MTIAVTSATEADSAIYEACRQYTQAENPSAFLALNAETEVFTHPDADGAIAYRRAGHYLVQFGGPFAPDASYGLLLERFEEHARSQDLELVAVQLQRRDAEHYAARDYTVNQIGASWAVPLTGFSLAGGRFMQLRNKIKRARRCGLDVQEVDAAAHAGAIAEIDRSWLSTKGEDVHQLEFLVGQIGGPAQRHRRLFVGSIDGRMMGYISYSPVYGSRAGWLHDLSRRVSDAPPGLMEAINSEAIRTFRSEGSDWLHFGFTPFSGLDSEVEISGHSLGFQWLMNALWHDGAQLYPAQTQLDYKQKWAADVMLPEYIAFPGRASIAGFVHVFRACNAL